MDGAPLENIDLAFDCDESWGEQPFGAPMPRAFRLSDAERIAAHRLDGAAEGSLKEALATVIVDSTDEGARLGERLERIVAAAHATGHDPLTPTAANDDAAPAQGMDALQPMGLSQASEVDFGWFGAVPPAHAVPCFEEREPDQDFIAAFAPPPSVTLAPMAMPSYTGPERAAQITAETLAPAPHEMRSDVDAAIDATAPAASVPAAPQAPRAALPEDPNLEPIVTAYAASARLAADAAAASQALFELQRLLNQQKLEASPELSVAMEAHGIASLDTIPAAQQPLPDTNGVAPAPRAPDPVTDESLVPPRVVQPVPAAPQRAASFPPPLPAPRPAAPRELPPGNAAPVRRASTETSPRKAPSRPSAAPRNVTRGERRRTASALPAWQLSRASSFDVRGFAAGFALSGAIGVVLYFVMATS